MDSKQQSKSAPYKKRGKGKKPQPNYRGKQGPKDSKDPRVNFDNERESKFDERFEKDHSNDVAWYAHNPEMLKAAGSIGFSNITGQTIPLTGSIRAVPGVMSFVWTPGYTSAKLSAVNQAKQNIYSYVVHANSRNQSYDAADLMMSILAGNEIFTLIASMVRCYGTIRNFQQENMYTPKSLVMAMGFDYDDCVSNLSKMWFDINELISRSTQIWIPKNIPLISRQFWMCSNIYADGDTPKSQYYMYTKCAYLKYGDTNFEDGTSLLPFQVTNKAGTGYTAFCPGAQFDDVSNVQYFTWAQWMEAANIMFDALLNSLDRGLMFGDVLKAYGKENLYTIAEVPADYRVTTVYNQEVLTQFENLTTWTNTHHWGIKQDPTTGDFVPITFGTWTPSKLANTGAPKHVVMNFHTAGQPTPEAIMVATRMQYANMHPQTIKQYPSYGSDPGTPKDIVVNMPSCTGTELCLGIAVFSLRETLGVVTVEHYWVNQYAGLGTINPMLWTTFDWAPWIYESSTEEMGTDNFDALNAAGDFDNYAIITEDDLIKLHTAAVYSEYGVPIM